MKKIFVFCAIFASCEFSCSFIGTSNKITDAGRITPICPVPEGVRPIEPACDVGYNPICQKIIVEQMSNDSETKF